MPEVALEPILVAIGTKLRQHTFRGSKQVKGIASSIPCRLVPSCRRLGDGGVDLLGSEAKIKELLRLGASMIQSSLRLARAGSLSTLLFFIAQVPAGAAEQVEVAGELARLSEAHGFSVTGLDQTQEVFGRAEGDELFPRLRRLLENFDHVIVQGPTGGVDRVIVLGQKVPYEPLPPVMPDADTPGTGEESDIVMETERRGSQHLVHVSLGGTSGPRVERDLQVDTGADYLVLPLTLASKLGVKKRELQEQEMQTANGKVKAHIGRLPSLWLGQRRLKDIETAFLEDDKLSGGGLLGMSVLRRYKLTIDDANNRITLGGKQGDEPAAEVDEDVEDEQDLGSENPDN